MSKLGRPRKDGVKPPWHLCRTVVGLCGYGKERRAGGKYEASLESAVAEVKRAYPHLPMSLTEMKRILAESRPKTGLKATFLVAECENFALPEGRMTQRAWEIRIGPQPNYRRHNAV
jgi:hypothetical protein